jgi:hypothetical protein
MDALDDLQHVYRLYVGRQRARSLSIEHELKVDLQEAISEDERRNEPDNFRRLFRAGESPELLGLYRKLMHEMRGKHFEECADELAGLRFIVAVVMKAVMSYQASRADELARFSNSFDRLDDIEVRRQLWEKAQESTAAN